MSETSGKVHDAVTMNIFYTSLTAKSENYHLLQALQTLLPSSTCWRLISFINASIILNVGIYGL